MHEKTSLVLVDKRGFFRGAGYRSRTFSGSNPPTANFFRLLCSVYLPQKVRGIFGLKTQKTGLSLAVIAIPKPVFAGFTVFWTISALKARKLPDLSGRQIRQSIWKRYRVLIEKLPRGCTACSGGFNRVRGGFKFQRGFKVNDWVAPTNWNLFVQCSRYNCYYVLIRVQTHIRGTSSVLQYQHM